MFARFDEIPEMTGNKTLWTDNVKTVYPQQTMFTGGYNYPAC